MKLAPSRLLTLCLAACAWGAVASTHAAIDCWIDAEHPKTGDSLAVTDPRVAPMRGTLHKLNALLHAQPALHALPRVRLRSHWQIAGQWNEPARGANFLLRDYRESVWGSGCSVIPGADRQEPRATIVATFNAPESVFGAPAPEVYDEGLRAWREPQPTGTLNGHTLYGGHMLVFTRSGRLPWVKVTTAEYLDFTERDLTRRLEETQAAEAKVRQAMEPSEQEAMLERVAAGLRKTNPAEAEKLIAEIREQQAQAQKAMQAAAARRRAANPAIDDAPFETMLRKVRAYRASLTPAQLAAQARLGVTGLHPADLPVERQPGLVKPDPQMAWDRQAPASAQLLMVSVRGGQEFEAPMQEVLRTLDLAALQALVRKPGPKP